MTQATDLAAADSRHTPGPWTWEPQDASLMILGKKGSFGVDLEHSVLSVTRCETCQKDPDRLRCFMPNDEDARLIAAAPDLLKALQDLLQVTMAFSERAPGIKAAQNAIAKATGDDDSQPATEGSPMD